MLTDAFEEFKMGNFMVPYSVAVLFLIPLVVFSFSYLRYLRYKVSSEKQTRFTSLYLLCRDK